MRAYGANLFVSIVLDGVGIGAQPDADRYGDAGSHTLGHVCRDAKPSLPYLTAAGLGNIARLEGVPAAAEPEFSWGRMEEQSAGKDSTTGHWELAGLYLANPFPTYPDGFPDEVLEAFKKAAGVAHVLGNEAASGTEIIARLGPEHLSSGAPIVYTSADSVFQIAAHVDEVPLETLYAWCRIARKKVCVGPHAVGRVIARPFEGTPGSFSRLSDRRKDYALAPSGRTLQERLRVAGVRTLSVGKVADLFAGVGFDETIKTGRNQVGIKALLTTVREWDGTPTFVWANLIDFDQKYGHRNDVQGFAASLEEFDSALAQLLEALPAEAGLLITADHGNDPTHPGTDHTREYVPVLLRVRRPRSLGTRESFRDHAATVLDWFGISAGGDGASMLETQ